MSTQHTSSEKKHRSSVTSFIKSDGTLDFLIYGRVHLHIYGNENEEALTLKTEDKGTMVSIDDPDKEPGRHHKYRACFGLNPDGTFTGFYVDEQAAVHHFRGPAKGRSQAAALAAGKPWRPVMAPSLKKKGTGQQ